jgi:Transglycosylase SLT domain
MEPHWPSSGRSVRSFYGSVSDYFGSRMFGTRLTRMSVNQAEYLTWIMAFGLALVTGSSSADPAKPVGDPATPATVLENTDVVIGPVSDRAAPEASLRSLPKPPQTQPPSPRLVKATIERFAGTYQLDLDLVHSLIKAESAYDVHAVSRAGAVGLMQVMPATGADYGVTSVDALFDPEINLRTGMQHLKRLLDKYDSIGQAVMAYNAGEGALERGGGFVAYPETQKYTHAVLVSYLRKKGVQPYSAQARQVVGMDVTPAMAQASGGGADAVGTADSDAASTAETFDRPRATRLTSRLAPGLSRVSKDGRSAPAPRSVSHSVLDRNVSRLSVRGK